MKNQLWILLETLGYPVYEQGSLTGTEDYPEHFFTLWNDDTEPLDHYDNEESGYVWYFTINFYSIDPRLTESVLMKAKDLLIKNGWIVPGKGNDTYSDSKNHYGRSIEIKFIEIEGGEN